MPMKAMDMRKPARLAVAKTRFRNRPSGEDRVRDPALDDQEGDQATDGQGEQAQDLRRSPRPAVPAPAQGQQQGHEGDDDQAGARRNRSCPGAGAVSSGIFDQDHEQGQARQRQVDVEDPAPAGDRRSRSRWTVARSVKKPPISGPMHAGQAEHRAEHAAELAPLARREEVGDDGEGGGEQGAAAQALDGAEHDQLGHAAAEQRQVAELARQAAQHRAEQEQARCRRPGPACGRRCRSACRRSAPSPSRPADRRWSPRCRGPARSAGRRSAAWRSRRWSGPAPTAGRRSSPRSG